MPESTEHRPTLDTSSSCELVRVICEIIEIEIDFHMHILPNISEFLVEALIWAGSCEQLE